MSSRIYMCCNFILYVSYFKLVCVVILIIMYCISSYNQIYFLKFIVHKINSEMVESGMVKQTGREKADVAMS
jgi:hypothetical protein